MSTPKGNFITLRGIFYLLHICIVLKSESERTVREMSFITRLEYLMRKNGIKNNAELAKLSGVPYTTIDGFYKKGTDNIKLSTLKKLARCLHCSLDFLADEVRPVTTLAAHFEGEDFTEEELEEIDNFVKFVKSKRR